MPENDKSKYQMVGIQLFCSGYDGMFLKFMGETDANTLINILSDHNFNENDWMADLEGMLEENHISHIMCVAEPFSCDGYPERGMGKESAYTDAIASSFDIFIAASSFRNEMPDGEQESAQYVYVFSDEGHKAKRIEHISGINGNTEEFWDETYVSSVEPGTGHRPKYRMDAKVSCMDQKRCVPYYDRFVILKYIWDIDDCDTLRDYVEEETRGKLEENSICD